MLPENHILKFPSTITVIQRVFWTSMGTLTEAASYFGIVCTVTVYHNVNKYRPKNMGPNAITFSFFSSLPEGFIFCKIILVPT